MKTFISAFFLGFLSFGQTFEITQGQSMCMTGKGVGQDATINPYAEEEYSYALVENLGAVVFQIRIVSIKSVVRQFPIKPSGLVVIKLLRDDVLYFDALREEKAKAAIKYTLDESELPPPPPPVNKSKIAGNSTLID